MALLLWLYPLLILTLIGTAIYLQIHTKTLSLPVSPFLTISTILFPLFSLLSPIIPSIPAFKRRSGLHFLWQQAQVAITTILATLYSSSLGTNPCVMESSWRKFWQSHDVSSIRTIQDFFSCCGFRSLKDMAWPFDSPQRNTCALQFHRQEACSRPWEKELKKTSGAGLGVVLGTFFLQVLLLVVKRRNSTKAGAAGRERNGGWMGRVIQEVFTGDDNGDQGGEVGDGVRRPLLGAPSASRARAEEGGENTATEDRRDEDEEEEEEEAYDEGYGGTLHGVHEYPRQRGEGLRVEVSHHHQDPWAGA